MTLQEATQHPSDLYEESLIVLFRSADYVSVSPVCRFLIVLRRSDEGYKYWKLGVTDKATQASFYNWLANIGRSGYPLCEMYADEYESANWITMTKDEFIPYTKHLFTTRKDPVI